MLEVQKSSSQQNLDNLVELAMERDMCANEKFEEVMIIKDNCAWPVCE